MVAASLISNIFKIRYEIMNETFKNMDKTKKIRILTVIDIGKVIRTMMGIISKKNMIITKKHKAQVMIGVLNIIAHYRHYDYSILRSSNSFLLYCQDTNDYEEFEDIISEMSEICKFIPNLIMIPKMNSPVSKYFYLHTASYIIEHSKKSTAIMQKELVVMVLGSNPLEYQFSMICDKTYYLSHGQSLNKIMDYKKIWINLLGENENFNNVRYSYELKQLILPYMILHKKIDFKDHSIVGITGIRNVTRTNKLFDFIDNLKNDSKPIWEHYINTIGLPEDKDEYNKILNEVFYLNNSKIKPFIKDFVKSWSQKLTDKKLNNINEYSEILNQNNINILWLQEDRGE